MIQDPYDEFQLQNGLIYLNHAGVSPWPSRTARAVQRFAEENLFHGATNYPEWMDVEGVLRRRAKELFHASSEDEIALLKNTSEALSIVAYGLDWIAGDNVVSSDQEFPSNRIVWESLAQKGVEFREADLSSSSSPEDSLFSLVDNRTRLITISSVQYGTGLRMDLERIGAFCKKREILFCIDAIQSLGAVQFDVQEAQGDFVMADGHKWMLAPEGLALFYSHPDARDRLKLSEFGWHMVEAMLDFEQRHWQIAMSSRRFECGSMNMLGAHALNASLSLLLETGMEKVEASVLQRSRYLIDNLNSIPGLRLLTPTADKRYAGIITFLSQDADPAHLFRYLTQNNVFCALRSGGIRLSPHFYTPLEQLDRTFELVRSFLEKR